MENVVIDLVQVNHILASIKRCALAVMTATLIAKGKRVSTAIEEAREILAELEE